MLALRGARTSMPVFEAFSAGPLADATCQSPPELPDAVERFAEIRDSDSQVRSSLARHGSSFRDSRIRAAYAIAPAVGMALTEDSLGALEVPIRIVVGDADEIAPPGSNAIRLAGLIPGCRPEILPGVGHYTFLAECTPRGGRILPICRNSAGVDRAAIHHQVAEDALAFFTGSLRSGKE